MRARIRTATLALALASLTSCAAPRAEEQGFVLHDASRVEAPPPPSIVYETQPRLEAVPGTTVFIVDDPGYDMFTCEGFWYLAANGWWYRASAHDGPYMAVDARVVPKEIRQLPLGRWKRHGPIARESD